jgi:sterol desaturase/sphingolipid hydroxylase (fatty acid hydroxylase superfamily)
MIDFLLAHEGALRLSSFVGILLIMLGWEQASPRRAPSTPRLINLGLVVIDAALLWLLLPAAAVSTSLFAGGHGWGLFNTVAAPPWLAALVTLVALDLAVWAQHVAMHKVGPLWRLHRVHHSDLDFDTTTGIRFHPLEILLSTIYKAMVVMALGAPVTAVIAFEILLNGSSLFAHGNVRLPPAVDETIRRVVVTPDMHRVHHSVRRRETDSNYGFNLSVWDRLFGTYRAQPHAGHDGMIIGLPEFRRWCEQRLGRLLLQPLLPG